jgi:hypothetical protein
MRTRAAITTLFLLFCPPLGAASAQGSAPECGTRGSREWLATRPSPLDSATLSIHGAAAKVCYSRPRLRGRSVDSLLPLGRAWRTGANEPTTLTLTHHFDVGGAALSPGRYVILTVPRPDYWFIVFHTTEETDPGRMFATMKQVGIGRGRVEVANVATEQFTITAVSDSLASEFILGGITQPVGPSVRGLSCLGRTRRQHVRDPPCEYDGSGASTIGEKTQLRF